MSLTGAGLRTMRSVPNFGTVGALAEIIDNSIQWRVPNKTCNINVVLIEKGSGKTVKDVIITDNGIGMGSIIDRCLWFGGGTNHGAKTNLGKYGVGLPYACCSQSETYHVYSWQERGKYKYVYRKHSEWKDDDLVDDKPHTQVKSLPEIVLQTCPELKEQASGTVIYWENCDEVDPKKAETIIRHTEERLGRLYRNFISDEIHINWKPFRQAAAKQAPTALKNLTGKLKINDPLRLIKSGTILSNAPYSLTEGQHDIFEAQFSKPKSMKSEPDPDLNGHIHEVSIRVSIAKPEVQKPNGKDGGKTVIGKLCARDGGMITLIRAKRELKLGNFGFEAPNSGESRLRWLKIEVSFDPISDKLWGVNANKTNAQKFRMISTDQYESHSKDGDGSVPWDFKYRYEIGSFIAQQIKEAYKIIENRGSGSRKKKNKTKCGQCLQFTVNNGKCSTCGDLEQCITHQIPYENGVCPVCESVMTPAICLTHKTQLDNDGNCPKCSHEPVDFSQDERDELNYILKENYAFQNCSNEGIQSSINWFLKTGKDYFVIFAPDTLNADSLITYRYYDGRFTLLFVNTCHAFYKSHIEIHYQEGDDELESLILFLISWVAAELHHSQDTEMYRKLGKFRARFGIELSDNLADWVDIIGK